MFGKQRAPLITEDELKQARIKSSAFKTRDRMANYEDW